MHKYRYYEIGKKPRDIVTEKPLELEELQELVGGYIEFMPLKNGNTLCVDEEGLIKRRAHNSFFTQKDTEVDIEMGLRGNVVEGKVREDGEFVGIDE